MDVPSLKQDVLEGKIGVDRLIDVIAMLSKKLGAANKRIDELEAKLGESTTTKLDEPFLGRGGGEATGTTGQKAKKEEKQIRS